MVYGHIHVERFVQCPSSEAKQGPGFQSVYFIQLHHYIFPSHNQQDAAFLDLFISADALHVSGGSSTHHQEHKTVHTASGIVNQYCC